MQTRDIYKKLCVLFGAKDGIYIYIQGDQFESGKSIKLFLALPVELGPSFFDIL